MSEHDTEQIRRLVRLMLKLPRQKMEQKFAEEGFQLSMLQFAMLGILRESTLTNSELSKRFGLDPSTLVPSIDAMVRRGYLERKRDTEDRRRYPLYITEEGHAMIQHLHDVYGDPLNKAIAHLDHEEMTAFVTILRKIIQHLPDGDEALTALDNVQSDDC